MTVLQRRTLRSRQRRQSLSTASWWVLRPDSNPICSPHHDLVRKQPQGAAPLFCSGARLWSQLLIWIRAPAFRSTTNVSSEFSSSTELHLGSFYLPKDSLGQVMSRIDVQDSLDLSPDHWLQASHSPFPTSPCQTPLQPVLWWLTLQSGLVSLTMGLLKPRKAELPFSATTRCPR